MTTLARTTLAPRYGSPADVAAFLGLSVKTVRRRVESGALPAYREGRRVLVAYRDADQLVRRNPTMAIAHPTDRPVIDPATGQIRALSAEEHRAQCESLSRTLDEMAGITDETDTDEAWGRFFRELDAARPEYPPAGGTS